MDRHTRFAASICICTLMTRAVRAQVGQTLPRDYHGPQVRVDGIYVTPIPGAPFVADVQIVSHGKLPDGTEHVVKTQNHVARSSSGRIRNERRRLVPATFAGEPALLSVHLYDPSNRMSIFYDPYTHVAREEILPTPPRAPAGQTSPAREPPPAGVTVTDLGTEALDGVQLQGTRKARVIPAELSGTGQPVEVTDETWYSPDLAVYMIIKHNDPRTGEQLVAVTHVQRQEPSAEELAVPADYKIVDETPPPRQPATKASPAQ